MGQTVIYVSYFKTGRKFTPATWWMIADYCDGEVFRQHPLFSRDLCALQIQLYYDDVEVVNPLGSKTTKHKVGNKILFLYFVIVFSYVTSKFQKTKHLSWNCKWHSWYFPLMFKLNSIFYFHFYPVHRRLLLYTWKYWPNAPLSVEGRMQLQAMAKKPVIKKYGCNEILQSFMTQLNQLEQVITTCTCNWLHCSKYLWRMYRLQ